VIRDLWGELYDYLGVEAEVAKLTDGSGGLQVTVKVENRSRGDGRQAPMVIFDDVRVLFGSGDGLTEVELGTVEQGQTIEHAFNTDYAGVLDAGYDVRASIRADAFFQMSRVANRLSSGAIAMPISEYVNSYKALEIETRFAAAVKEIPIPTNETALGELESMATNVHRLSTEASELQVSFDRLASVVERSSTSTRELLLAHRRTVEAYLGEVRSSLGALSKAIREGKQRQAQGLADGFEGSTHRALGSLSEATERLSGLS